MSQEKDPSDPKPRVAYSPWFPCTGTDETGSSCVAEVVFAPGFEARLDPAADALRDGKMASDKDGKVIPHPMRVLRTRSLEATPDIDGGSPA